MSAVELRPLLYFDLESYNQLKRNTFNTIVWLQLAFSGQWEKLANSDS